MRLFAYINWQDLWALGVTHVRSSLWRWIVISLKLWRQEGINRNFGLDIGDYFVVNYDISDILIVVLKTEFSLYLDILKGKTPFPFTGIDRKDLN